MQLTGQNTGRTASSAFLLARKGNWLARTCIMNVRNETCVETQTSKVPTQVAFLLISILWPYPSLRKHEQKIKQRVWLSFEAISGLSFEAHYIFIKSVGSNAVQTLSKIYSGQVGICVYVYKYTHIEQECSRTARSIFTVFWYSECIILMVQKLSSCAGRTLSWKYEDNVNNVVCGCNQEWYTVPVANETSTRFDSLLASIRYP